ncbi:MAG: hypothetical protein R3C12_13695 [Planctomycetaceae bacterium]
MYQRVTDKGSTPVVVENAVYVQGEKKTGLCGSGNRHRALMANLEMENPQYGSPVAGETWAFMPMTGWLFSSCAPIAINR